MRYNFDLSEPRDADDGGRQSAMPTSASTPKKELEWLPLQNHPVFSSPNRDGAAHSSNFTMPKNLLAWDGASRLYFWDSYKSCLHRLSVRLGEPDPTSVLAASPSKVLQADMQLDFEVQRISINRNGSALFLVGLDGLYVMYLYGRTSTKENTVICRTVSVGSEIYFDKNNSIRTLQVCWHPYSDTHLGILSSDSVFRVYDLSSALGQPEQEYYLQPVEPGSSHNATSICPVDFSFGGDHLWDRFSVFILFSDGSVYILCPVVPFGSVYKWESILELYSDAHVFGLKSSNSKAVKNSNLAISWLEATFPELARKEVHAENASVLRAQPYALFDASISLQGPLRKVSHSVEEDSVHPPVCEGRAVSFLYDLVSKDSIVVTAWSGGQLQIDALADEVQPVWKVGSPPRVCLDSTDSIVGLAMICESLSSDTSILKLDLPPDHTLWLGHSPPLLRLAIVDLALPRRSGSIISMFVDPLISERIYCLHDGGIDSVVLHFFPFTNQSSGKEDMMRSPSVHPVLSTFQGEASSASPLCGFLALSDSFGDSWIVGLTPSCECIVLEMETWNTLVPPIIDKVDKLIDSEGPKDTDIPTIISKELLTGPRVVLLPPSSPHLRSVAADSIEGRSTLHQYFKLFHENYVEYAHKVYFELQHHAPHVKKIIDDQHSRLHKAQQKILEVERKQEKIEDRIEHAVQFHSKLEERLQSLRHLPAAHKRSLSKAEREFKSELDRYRGVELDALRFSIEAVNARLKRFTHSPQASRSNEQRQLSVRRKSHVQENEMSLLKASLEKLSLVNSENAKKVKVVESALKCREIGTS
ncbi:PREDICTED: nuclear pore complex protein NUP88 [Nicotiana attenuata]|uniref:Nuclear pore complex protein nup88 n=1 Tax=Nicotiana attenuata TaxID=49451 RepID=A0A314KZH2_NICAT|nr:PREDICTED: nuclear pore complex protein NUP88 [Nicotiana attenuata]XP_019266724.1 PREDICTED: nuclear pore complex protein NUP88 [Nicotiana attenuata]OIT34848.1 nuclear pore complex protein nup88 [Nicotiana attenuata]